MFRRRFLFFILACFTLAPPLFAQSRSAVFTINSSTSPCATIGITGQSTVGIDVSGTFSITLQPEVAIQGGGGARNTQVTPTTSSTAQATITAAGGYSATVGGYDVFLVCPTSYASGSATIVLTATPAVNTTTISGGGVGGGSVTVVGGGNLASSAVVTGGGLQKVQTPSATSTLDTSGNMSLAGKLNLGTGAQTVCGTAVNCLGFAEGSTSGLVPTAGFDAIGFDSTQHGFVLSLNGGSAFFSGANVPPLGTQTNCANTASPAVCGSAAAGAFTVFTSATTEVVNTTAVTATSRINITEDSSLGTQLGITCNTTIYGWSISARTPGTSFTLTISAAPVTNKGCFSYTISN